MVSPNSYGTKGTSSIKLTVVPCAIAIVSIQKVQTGVGSRLTTLAHPLAIYANPESTLALCGAITYQLVNGDTPYLSYDPALRSFTFTPTSTAAHGAEMTFYIKATSTNFNLNTTNSPVKV
jgi:hypothetical protein